MNVPLHTIIKLTTAGYKTHMEIIKLNIACVDTYRQQPKDCSVIRSPEEALHTVPDHYDSLNVWSSPSLIPQNWSKASASPDLIEARNSDLTPGNRSRFRTSSDLTFQNRDHSVLPIFDRTPRNSYVVRSDEGEELTPTNDSYMDRLFVEVLSKKRGECRSNSIWSSNVHHNQGPCLVTLNISR